MSTGTDDIYEDRLIKEAIKAKSQWKPPSLANIGKAIVLSDHYTWMWTPSSILFIYMAYIILRLCENGSSYFSTYELALPFYLSIPPVLLFW